MTRSESTVILTHCTAENQICNCCRLIRTVDIFHGNNVFSVFLTTKTQDDIDEEFVYDISHDEIAARRFFSLICREHVTACTLADIAKDHLSEA